MWPVHLAAFLFNVRLVVVLVNVLAVVFASVSVDIIVRRVVLIHVAVLAGFSCVVRVGVRVGIVPVAVVLAAAPSASRRPRRAVRVVGVRVVGVRNGFFFKFFAPKLCNVIIHTE